MSDAHDTMQDTIDDVPKHLPGWVRDAWQACVLYALGVFAVGAALSLVVAISAAAVASGVVGGEHSSLLGTSIAGATDVEGRTFLGLWAAALWAAHLAPITVGSADGTAGVYGVGPLGVTGVLLVFAYRAGREMELSSTPCPALARAGRAARLGIPYAGLCLITFITAAAVGTGSAELSIGPSAIGLITAPLLVTAAAALGALSARPSRPAVGVVMAVRAAVAGLAGVVVGLVVLAVAAVVVAIVEGPDRFASPGSAGVASTLGGIVLMVAYAPNLLGVGWGLALGMKVLSDGGLAVLVVAPVLGAAAGSLLLRKRSGVLEKAAFTLSFAVLSTVLALCTTPTAWSSESGESVSAGSSPFAVLLMGAVVGGLAALVAPYVPLRGRPGWSRFVAATQRALGISEDCAPDASPSSVVEGAASPGEREQAGRPVVAGPGPTIRLPRRVWVAATGTAIAVVGVMAVNAMLSGHYSVDSAVQEYFAAQASGDPGRILDATVYRTGGHGLALTDRAALEHMERVRPRGRSVSDVTVTSVREHGEQASAVVTYRENGTPREVVLTLTATHGGHLGLYPAWRVVVDATELTIQVGRLHGPLSVDGRRIPVQGESASVQVVPGTHRLTMAAVGIYGENDHTLDVEDAQTLWFDTDLSPQALVAARTAVDAYLAACAAAPTLEPAHCPNAEYRYGDRVSNVHWAIDGDPALDASLALMDDGSVHATGPFTMLATYDYSEDCTFFCDTPGVQHESDRWAGDFDLTLRWNGQSFDAKETY